MPGTGTATKTYSYSESHHGHLYVFRFCLDCLPREAVAFPTTYTGLAFHFSFRDFFQTVKQEIVCELQIPMWPSGLVPKAACSSQNL